MGNFYTKVTIRGPVQADIVALLRDLGRSAFLTPTTNAFTLICDLDCENQDPDLLASLALTVSTRLSCPAWAVLNHDNDVLWYQLYEHGNLVDAYISDKQWWEEPPPQGNSETPCKLMGNPGEPGIGKKILARSSGMVGYLFEIRRHQELLKALGQPLFAAGLGFNYASRGEVAEGLEPGQLLLV